MSAPNASAEAWESLFRIATQAALTGGHAKTPVYPVMRVLPPAPPPRMDSIEMVVLRSTPSISMSATARDADLSTFTPCLAPEDVDRLLVEATCADDACASGERCAANEVIAFVIQNEGQFPSGASAAADDGGDMYASIARVVATKSGSGREGDPAAARCLYDSLVLRKIMTGDGVVGQRIGVPYGAATPGQCYLCTLRAMTVLIYAEKAAEDSQLRSASTPLLFTSTTARIRLFTHVTGGNGYNHESCLEFAPGDGNPILDYKPADYSVGWASDKSGQRIIVQGPSLFRNGGSLGRPPTAP
jgi:hypothetical protein